MTIWKNFFFVMLSSRLFSLFCHPKRRLFLFLSSRAEPREDRKRKSPGKPRLFLQSFEKNYFFLAAFLAVFLPPFLADFLAAFFLGAAFLVAFFAMVFGFEKFICDEVIKNYDTKENIQVVFFNIDLLISMKFVIR